MFTDEIMSESEKTDHVHNGCVPLVAIPDDVARVEVHHHHSSVLFHLRRPSSPFDQKTTLRRISSGTFRTWSFTPRAPECEKITGAEETLRMSFTVNLLMLMMMLLITPEGVLHGELGDVGKVDHHAQPVHLDHHLSQMMILL